MFTSNVSVSCQTGNGSIQGRYVRDNDVTDSDEVATTAMNNDVTSQGAVDGLTLFLVISYGTICLGGLIGNALVAYVIVRGAPRMKTVTNVFILNLAITDTLFLLSLPTIMTTAITRRWVFGAAMCYVHYAQTCINMFTGTFTLTLMSADRFAAVWYPVRSLRYRTPRMATIASLIVWLFSFVLMFPVILYADHVPQPNNADSPVRYSCMVRWPADHALAAARVYVAYTAVIGFALPVGMITSLYAMLVARLRSTRRHIRSGIAKTKRLSMHHRRNVTSLVAIIIAVFVICWLPYWVFQAYLAFGYHQSSGSLQRWKVYLFQACTVLSYANSAVNPILYAFTNETFKKAFASACGCGSLMGDRTARADTTARPYSGINVSTHPVADRTKATRVGGCTVSSSTSSGHQLQMAVSHRPPRRHRANVTTSRCRHLVAEMELIVIEGRAVTRLNIVEPGTVDAETADGGCDETVVNKAIARSTMVLSEQPREGSMV